METKPALHSKLPDEILTLMAVFKEAGFEIFVVGGSVRDMLLGREIADWDFTTNATPEQILELYPHGKYENAFGTVLVPSSDDEKDQPGKGRTLPLPLHPHLRPPVYEITPFRTEGRYSDGRHPDEITWASTVEEDLQRRDFTINALALSHDGSTIIDVAGGQNDLKNRIIRAVGDPRKRFEEDALRMMRAVRIVAQLGFTIEEKTFTAIAQNANLITQISQERIHDELMKILSTPDASRSADAFLQLKDTGLLAHILPELLDCFGVEQKSPGRHHTLDVGTHLIEALRHCPSSDPIVRFATLLHDIGKTPTRAVDPQTKTVTFYNHEIVGATMTHAIAERLRFSKKDRDLLVKLVRYHMFSVGEEQTDKAIRRFIRRIGKEHVQDMIALRTADRLGSGASETSWRTDLFKKKLEEVQRVTFEIRDLAISGQDVMETLNISPGPAVGHILKQIFEKVDDGILPNERGALLQEITPIVKSSEEGR